MTFERVTVFGGVGFVGSSLVPMLARSGKRVQVIDSLFTGSPDLIPNDVDYELVKADIDDVPSWSNAMSVFAPEVVVNLAAIHFIPYCNRNPHQALQTNLMGFHRVLEHAGNAKAVVFASSAAVYGPSDDPHTETEPMLGTDIYGLTKVYGEQLMALWSGQSGVCCRAARFFNVVGPNETNPHLLPEILHQSRSGDVIQLGNIDTKRDYVYVDDIARGVLALIDSCSDGIKFDSYNVGTGEEYSAREMIEMLAHVSGRPIQAVSVPERYRPSDRMHLCSNSNKLRALGWEPQETFESSMRKTWEHFETTGQLLPY